MVEQSRPREGRKSFENPRVRNELLTTNTALNELVLQVGRTVPDLGQVQASLPQGHGIRGRVGIYAEALLDHILRNIAETESWKKRLLIKPLEETPERGNYQFVKGPIGGSTAYRDGNTSVEYDNITQVAGLPVVWEVKTRKPESKPSKPNEAFLAERIQKLATPLQERFETTRFGYVVVMNPEVVNPNDEGEQQAFISEGGIILPLAVAYSQLVEGVRRLEGN